MWQRPVLSYPENGSNLSWTQESHNFLETTWPNFLHAPWIYKYMLCSFVALEIFMNSKTQEQNCLILTQAWTSHEQRKKVTHEGMKREWNEKIKRHLHAQKNIMYARSQHPLSTVEPSCSCYHPHWNTLRVWLKTIGVTLSEQRDKPPK